MRGILSIAAVSLITASAMGQVNLNALMVADDSFQASISTDPNAAGSVFLSGSNFNSTFSGSTTLPGPGTYYLQIRAETFGGQRMMSGLFTLDNPLATFANGSSSLVSGISTWTVSDTGFGIAPAAPVVVPNGWGSFVGLESAAFIWHSSPESVAYFTAEITVVPAPASLALLSLFALGRRRR
jgi:hypothetical protein